MTKKKSTQTGATNRFNNGGSSTKRFINNKKGDGNRKVAPKINGSGKGKGFTTKMTEGVMKGIVVSLDSGIPIVGQYKNLSESS